MLDDTFKDGMETIGTGLKTAKCVAQQVKKEDADLHTLFKGPVCTFVFSPSSGFNWSLQKIVWHEIMKDIRHKFKQNLSQTKCQLSKTTEGIAPSGMSATPQYCTSSLTMFV